MLFIQKFFHDGRRLIAIAHFEPLTQVRLKQQMCEPIVFVMGQTSFSTFS